jgi:hypothetical protein
MRGESPANEALLCSSADPFLTSDSAQTTQDGYLQGSSSPLTDSNRRPPPYHGGSEAVLACTGGRRRSRLSCKSVIQRVPSVPAPVRTCSGSCTRLVPATRCLFLKQEPDGGAQGLEPSADGLEPSTPSHRATAREARAKVGRARARKPRKQEDRPRTRGYACPAVAAVVFLSVPLRLRRRVHHERPAARQSGSCVWVRRLSLTGRSSGGSLPSSGRPVPRTVPRRSPASRAG